MLDSPRFAGLFGSGSRAEIPLVGWVNIGGEKVRVSGQIDRLAVTESEVLIADYKTNRPPPRIAPRAYVAQLALYRALLRKLYPDPPRARGADLDRSP